MAVPGRKLRLKFILLLAGFTSLPFFLVMSEVIVKIQDVQRRNAVDTEQLIALSASREIAEFIGLQFGVLDAIESVFPALSQNPDLQERFLERMLFSHDGFTDITVVNSKGRETARINRIVTITSGDLVDRSGSEEFLAVKEKSRFTSQIFWEGGRPYFVLGRGMFDGRNVFQGAIFTQVDARIMQEVVSRLSAVARKGRAYITDKAGIVVAHPDISQVFAAKDFSSIPTVTALIKKDTESLPTGVYRNELNQEVLGAGVPISLSFQHKPQGSFETNWFIIAELPAFIALATVREVTLVTFFILMALLLLGVLGAVLFARRIVYPIEKLHEASRQFGAGNLGYRVSIRTGDEIEELANGFYEMAGNLEKSIAAINKDRDIIAAEKNQLQHILSGITDAVIVTDLNRNIIIFNSTAERLTGYPASVALNTPLGQVIRVLNGVREISPMEYCPVRAEDFEGITMSKNALTLLSGAGNEAFVNLRAGQIRESKKANVGCILTLHDVTREYRIEAFKREFVSVAAHQLRTPMTAIKWSISMLLDETWGRLSKEQKHHTQITYDSAERMIALIDDLLEASRLEEGRYLFEYALGDILGVVEYVIETARGQIERKNLNLRFEKSSAKLPLIRMDVDMLRLAIASIMENAINYTPSGGRITVGVRLTGTEAVISVADTGLGIPKGAQDRVFTKFFRGENAIRMKTEGSGLGLFITKNIIEAHDGRIWFESEENKGTTFYVSIPLSGIDDGKRAEELTEKIF